LFGIKIHRVSLSDEFVTGNVWLSATIFEYKTKKAYDDVSPCKCLRF